MHLKKSDVKEILKSLSLSEAVEGARPNLEHQSKISKLGVQSWQAKIMRDNADIPKAGNPTELRYLMNESDVPIIFIPDEAVITQELLNTVCSESPFVKTIIWESV